MRNLSVKAKLLISAALSILSVVVLMGLSFFSANQSGKALASIYENEVQPMTTLMAIDADLKEVRFRMAGVLVDQMPFVGSKNHLGEVKDHIPKQWGAYKADIRDKTIGKEEAELIAKIEKKMSDLPVFFEKLSAAYAVSDKKQVSSLLEDDWPVLQGGLVKPLGQLVPLQQASVKTTYEGSIASGKKVLWVQIAVGLACLAMIVLFAVQLIMSMSSATAKLEQALARVAEGDLAARADVKQRNEFGRMADSLNATIGKLRDTVAGVKDAANLVAGAASELLAESGDVLKRADSQTDSIMQVSAAMEETTVAATEVAHSADNVEQAAASAQDTATEGNQHMARSADATRRIVEAVGSSANTIAGLSQSIDRVGEITRVIKEIADQTNLLALNAAIEAARAGEQGRGFAVVADEVRKLAERTATSTTDITNMIHPIKGATEEVVDAIHKIQQEVNAGNEYNNSAENSLRHIVDSANRVTEMARQIAGAVKEQSTASQDVAQQLERISTLSEENNVSIGNVDQAAKRMAQTAGELQKLVNHFRVVA